MEYLWTALAAVAEYLGVATVLNWIVCGYPHFRHFKEQPPKSYLIEKRNFMDTQDGPTCSAYASAYVLRHLGTAARGEDLYKIMPSKTRRGAVHPKGVVTLLNREFAKREFPKGKKYYAEYCFGSVKQLKREISRGIPVILFVKTTLGKHWLHFVPVVGYDEKQFFIAESLQSNRNDRALYYNRKVPMKEFKKLWNTMLPDMPLVRHTYIAVREVKKGLE